MSNRIRSLDVLRGFSITGILFMNIVGFHENYYYVNPLVKFANDKDVLLQQLSLLFIHNSFYPIFSFLFGFGMAIMADNMFQRGQNIFPPLIRRLLFLLVLGILHGSLLFYGDILNTYAIFGLLLLLFLVLSPRIALVSSICLVAVHFSLHFNELISFILKPEDYQVVLNKNNAFGNEVWQEAIRDRDYLLILGLNMGTFLGANTPLIGGNIFIFYLLTVFPFMLFGSYAYRTKLINTILKHKRSAIITACIFLIIGLTVKGFGIYHHINAEMMENFTYYGGIFIAISYIVFTIILCENNKVLMYLTPFEKIGKISLTCYIFQSISMFIIFYVLGLYSQLSLSQVFSIALILTVVQCVGAQLYLKRYKQGPLEYIWRKFTYWSK